MAKHPYAWVFFISFIITTTFTVLNLFIGIIVSTMQEEVEEASKAELAAERVLIEEETEPLLRELRSLRTEVAALRREITPEAIKPS